MPSVVGVIGDGSRWGAAVVDVMMIEGSVLAHGRERIDEIEIYQRRHYWRERKTEK